MSAREQVLDALRGLLPELKERFGVERVWLFGSVARAEDTPRSDVNILIDLPMHSTLFTLSRVKHRLQEVLGREVDVGTHEGLSRAARARILKECVRVE